MNNVSVQVLHLNVGKRRTVQNSLLNDVSIKDFDAISVVEPYVFQHPQSGRPIIAQDRHWQVFTPSTQRTGVLAKYAFRQALWVNTELRATQIPIACHDIAAVLLQMEKGKLLLIACYEARDGASTLDRENALTERFQAIAEAREKAEREAEGRRVEVLVCADLNRHHPLWGGQHGNRIRERTNQGRVSTKQTQTDNLSV